MLTLSDERHAASIDARSDAGMTAQSGEADYLCRLVDEHADDLRAARLGKAFRLQDVSFRLCRVGRNAIYRASRRFSWFLRLSCAMNRRFMAREQEGAEAVTGALGHRPDYCGALVIRVAVDRAYVLASAIPGTPLNRVLAAQSWVPGATASGALERAFGTLGTLLGTLHATARVGPQTPEAHERPFAVLKRRLDEVTVPDQTSETIAAWYGTHARPDHGTSFVHGNMRLDNVLKAGTRLGFVDFEHSGSGSFYQDLSRPVSQLLMTRATIAFPHERATRCLRAFLKEYGSIQRFDAAQLGDYVGCRFAHYYVGAEGRGMVAGYTAGLPVLRSKLTRLTRALLRDGLPGAFPDLRIQS